jgi:hypothetical protein
MINFIKSNWFKIVIVILLVGYLLVYSNNSSDGGSESKTYFSKNNISSATEVTCTYSQFASVSYKDNEVSRGLNKPEAHPMIFTFSKLNDPKESQLSYLDSTQTITTVPIYKVREDESEVVFLDGVGQSYLSTHTIFKKQGVSVYTKSVDLLGIPVGSLSIGTCVGY